MYDSEPTLSLPEDTQIFQRVSQAPADLLSVVTRVQFFVEAIWDGGIQILKVGSLNEELRMATQWSGWKLKSVEAVWQKREKFKAILNDLSHTLRQMYYLFSHWVHPMGSRTQ